MRWWFGKARGRRRPIREHLARTAGPGRAGWIHSLRSMPVLVAILFVMAVGAVSLLGENTIEYSVGQRIDRPIYARVDFQVLDKDKTSKAREAARASTPSYYTRNSAGITTDRIRADLRRLYQAAAAAETFEAFAAALKEMNLPADPTVYARLRKLVDKPDDLGRAEFLAWVDKLPLERQFVVRGLVQEPRDPASTTDYIVLVTPNAEGAAQETRIEHAELVPQGRGKALRGSAAEVARVFPFEFRSLVEAEVMNVFSDQPTIIYDQQRTEQAMRAAETATPPVMATHLKGKPFIQPGVLGSDAYALLRAHRAAFMEFLKKDNENARALRREIMLQRLGMGVIAVAIALALVVYARLYQPRFFERTARMLGFVSVLLGAFLVARLLNLRWPDVPEAVLGACLFASAVSAIANERRFAMGSMCILALLIAATIGFDIVFLLALLTGVVVFVYQLNEIRTRTKLITTGAITAIAVMAVTAAGGFASGATGAFIEQHTWRAGVAALTASLLVSGVLPFIERGFGIATALTLLEWRDPTKKLLQLLAREAPGTYTHSLALGTLAEAACDRIGANGLLAQVAALYHDIGKIPKADYFTENQEGGANRHDKLAPTMSLLIILGHVKDGLEMAREYKLPSVLRQFIAEHHGTTVVRYFHYVASEKHAQIATGRHDREVPETEFRYAGPKPRTRESAVLMLGDGVEGAVRALPEPTPGRIESVVHQIVTDRLNDGQLDDCDITLREVRMVEDSLVKSLCSIYHGRVSYPKARKPKEVSNEPARLSV